MNFQLLRFFTDAINRNMRVGRKGDVRRAVICFQRVVGRMWRFARQRVDRVFMRPRVVPLCNPNSFEKYCNSRRQGPPLPAYISYIVQTEELVCTRRTSCIC